MIPKKIFYLFLLLPAGCATTEHAGYTSTENYAYQLCQKTDEGREIIENVKPDIRYKSIFDNIQFDYERFNHELAALYLTRLNRSEIKSVIAYFSMPKVLEYYKLQMKSESTITWHLNEEERAQYRTLYNADVKKYIALRMDSKFNDQEWNIFKTYLKNSVTNLYKTSEYWKNVVDSECLDLKVTNYYQDYGDIFCQDSHTEPQ